MSKKKISVLIPDGESGSSIQVVRSLGITSKYNVFVSSSNKKTPVRHSRFCKQFFISDDPGFTKIRLAETIDIIKAKKIDIVLPVFLPGFEFCLRFKKTLEKHTQLPLMASKELYHTAAYKDTLAEFCAEEGIKTPRSLKTSEEDFSKKLGVLHFPVVLKPTNQYSGEGILAFESRDDLINHMASTAWEESDSHLVQEYYEDMETIGVNVICKNGKIRCYTIQRGLEAAPSQFGFSETIKFIDNKHIVNFTQMVMQKLNWEGVANIDLLYSFKTKNIYLLEINPRFWGVTLSGSVKAGINFPDLLIQASLNPDFDGFPTTFRKIRYAKFNGRLLKKMLTNTSPVTIFETGINYLFIDPLPSIVR